jgi:hypothetical protein
MLPGLYEPEEVAAWLLQVETYFGTPKSPEEWQKALRTSRSNTFRLTNDPTPRSHPALAGVYASFHSSAEWTGDNELVTRAGNDPAPWLGARAPHLDFPVYAPLRTLINSVTYLSRVDTRGGAFMYWPGSHRIAWDYFRRNPNDYLSQGERSQDQIFELLTREMEREPVEFTGNRGDVLIWHPFLLHSGSINKREETRLAIFGRWGVPVEEQPIYDFSREMWSYLHLSSGVGGEQFDKARCSPSARPMSNETGAWLRST